METIHYSGAIWKGDAVHPDLWKLLQQRNCLIELVTGQPPYRVTLGVPHHAGQSEDRIMQAWINPRDGQPGRPADKHAGLIGLAVFRALHDLGSSCKLVIAAHPIDHDPNKTPGSPYWNNVFSEPLPQFLLELHGAAKHRRHDLELSAGRNRLADPQTAGKRLAFSLADELWILAVQEQADTAQAQLYRKRQHTRGKLQNPALETLSLVRAGELGIPAYHLEMKSHFRKPSRSTAQPNEEAVRLARALALLFHTWDDPDSVRVCAAELGLPDTACLVRPSLEFVDRYKEAAGEATLLDLRLNYELRPATLAALSQTIDLFRKVNYNPLPEEPAEEWLWMIDRGEVVGRVLLMHGLSEYRMEDGQVDYWIRPSRRGQGYGYLILRLTLERMRQLGLKRILISCRADNEPSRKIIEANGGQFENEIEDYDTLRPGLRRRYWIEL